MKEKMRQTGLRLPESMYLEAVIAAKCSPAGKLQPWLRWLIRDELRAIKADRKKLAK